MVTIAPREIAGSRTAGRFDFQKNWALIEMLRLHASSEDYVLLFDFHEDVMVVDGDDDPQHIDFYQIKTRRSDNWTMNRLLQIPPKRSSEDQQSKLSILAKLYNNKLHFPANTRSLNFVSNAPFRFVLTEKTGQSSVARTNICASEICDEERATARKRLQAEHNLSDEPEFEPITHFRVTDLSLEDHASHAEGRLSQYLSSRAPQHRIPVSALYRGLFAEIVRRNNRTSSAPDFDELVRQKGLSRSTFERMLNDAGLIIDPNDTWAEIAHDLTVEGFSWKRRKGIEAAWRRFHTERLDTTNTTLRRAVEGIQTLASDLIENPPDRLSNFIDGVTERHQNARSLAGCSSDLVCAVALAELYERSELSQADTEPEEADE